MKLLKGENMSFWDRAHR